jgi:hypothetical protein
MKSTLSIGVAFIILLPLFASFSTAIPIEKSIHKTYNGTSNSENGTVTLTIRRGWNEHGFLSQIGYTLDINNTCGTKTVNYSYNITYHYLSHNAYEWRPPSDLPPLMGVYTNILPIPLPVYPFIVTIWIHTNTSTNLSLARTGIMLFNCYVLFIKGNETITGPS